MFQITLDHQLHILPRVAVFVKENLFRQVVSIHKNDDSLCVKIKRGIRGERRYLHTKIWMRLWMKLIFSRKKGEVIIQGDFNARTNVDDNLSKPDKFDKLINVDNDNNKIPPSIQKMNYHEIY